MSFYSINSSVPPLVTSDEGEDEATLIRYCRPIRMRMKRMGVTSIANLTESSIAGLSLTPARSGLEWIELVIPVICALGFIGNLLNLLVLTRRRLLCTLDRLEKSATYGLVALAFTDMMFCVSAFPYVFISKFGYTTDAEHVYVLYYIIHGIGCINLFLMMSTWLVVSMAINRLIVVIYPFHARQALGTCRTISTIVVIYVCSIISTAPFFLHIKAAECRWYHGEILYEITSRWRKTITGPMRTYIQGAWPFLAVFIPLVILALCNMRLIRALRHAILARRESCRGQNVQDKSHKVTLTLVIIVLMLLFLVSPSEILRYVNPYKSWGHAGKVIALVTNIMQSLNFAFNFVLYCVVNATFRQTLKSFFTCSSRESSDETETETMLSQAGSMSKTVSKFSASKSEESILNSSTSGQRHSLRQY